MIQRVDLDTAWLASVDWRGEIRRDGRNLTDSGHDSGHDSEGCCCSSVPPGPVRTVSQRVAFHVAIAFSAAQRVPSARGRRHRSEWIDKRKRRRGPSCVRQRALSRKIARPRGHRWRRWTSAGEDGAREDCRNCYNRTHRDSCGDMLACSMGPRR
jgi:hypothetical protein